MITRKTVRSRAKAAFTLFEVLVALGLGLFVTGIALSAFFCDQKLIHKIEILDAKNAVAQSMVMWAMTKPFNVVPSPPGVNGYPQGAPQFRQIGAAAIVYQGGTQYLQLQLGDWSTVPAPATIGNLTIPAPGH